MERGTFRLTFTPGPNAPSGMPAFEDTGKYLIHWHRVGDQWLIAEDISNSDLPLGPPPPERRPE